MGLGSDENGHGIPPELLDGEDFLKFRADGVQFLHPASWSRTVESSDEGTSIDLQSPESAFAIVGIYPTGPEPGDLLEQAVDTLRAEHPELEVEDLETVPAPLDEPGRPVGAEVFFISLDTVTHCWIRSWPLRMATAFVLVQAADRENEHAQAVFQGLCASLHEVSESADD